MKVSTSSLFLVLLQSFHHIGVCNGKILNTRQNANESLTNTFNTIRETYVLPGLAGFAKTADSFRSEVVGVRKYGDESPLQITDDFHVGSNTKAMTMTLIAILVEKGLIKWDTTISEALPELASKIPPRFHNVSVTMLGAHRSGMASSPYITPEFYLPLYDESLSPSEGRLYFVEYMLNRPQNGTQGNFFYDNMNYFILGAMIDALDCAWETSISKHLFTPLKMNCGFGPAPLTSESAVDNTWAHYRNSSASEPWPDPSPFIQRDNPPLYGPAGTVHCDVFSYSRFLQLHIDGAQGQTSLANGRLNISTESFTTLHTPYPGAGELYAPGGWFFVNTTAEREWAGGWTLTHTGSNIRNFAFAVVAPFFSGRAGSESEGIALAGLTNIGDSILADGPPQSLQGTREAAVALLQEVSA